MAVNHTAQLFDCGDHVLIRDLKAFVTPLHRHIKGGQLARIDADHCGQRPMGERGF